MCCHIRLLTYRLCCQYTTVYIQIVLPNTTAYLQIVLPIYDCIPTDCAANIRLLTYRLCCQYTTAYLQIVLPIYDCIPTDCAANIRLITYRLCCQYMTAYLQIVQPLCGCLPTDYGLRIVTGLHAWYSGVGGTCYLRKVPQSERHNLDNYRHKNLNNYKCSSSEAPQQFVRTASLTSQSVKLLQWQRPEKRLQQHCLLPFPRADFLNGKLDGTWWTLSPSTRWRKDPCLTEASRFVFGYATARRYHLWGLRTTWCCHKICLGLQYSWVSKTT
jgi:hypothetical protein